MLLFEERGKPDYPEKSPGWCRVENQQTQPTYDAESEYRTRATFVEGECSHHCAIPAPQVNQIKFNDQKNCLETVSIAISQTCGQWKSKTPFWKC